jgi:hypothetical protein
MGANSHILYGRPRHNASGECIKVVARLRFFWYH